MIPQPNVRDLPGTRAHFDYGVAVMGALFATAVASVFLIGGIIDWSERNITARTLWGVLAMVVSLLSPSYLVWLLCHRRSYCDRSAMRRWGMAVGLPLVLVAVPIALAVFGQYAKKPLLIP